MSERSSPPYRHRLVVPDLPALAQFLPLLEEMSESGWYSNFGPLARRLEQQLLTMFGDTQECCVTCSNATAGLSAALLATGRTGSVLIPAFTFPASLGAVRAVGMDAIVVDVGRATWGLEADLLDRALAASGARLVMLVAPFGLDRTWDDELAICRNRNVAVIIDNASGLGGPRFSRQRGGEFFEVFSMHATKPFAVGEGGAVFAPRRYEGALRAALNFALDAPAKPEGPTWGFNGKMSEFHAAIGIAQAQRFQDILNRRRAFATIYRDRLDRFPDVLYPRDVASSPWQFFPLLLPCAEAAERFIEIAARAGVEIRRYYRPSLSNWPGVNCHGACPIAEDLAERLCVLPVRALDESGTSLEIIDIVVDALDRTLGGHDHRRPQSPTA